jgi:hypothetical protein
MCRDLITKSTFWKSGAKMWSKIHFLEKWSKNVEQNPLFGKVEQKCGAKSTFYVYLRKVVTK